jgi:hypothetical protein
MARLDLEPLTPAEHKLIEALRSLPQGRLRERAETLMLQVLAFAASPTCNETQADGVPCPTPQNACDQCREVETILWDVARRLGARA